MDPREREHLDYEFNARFDYLSEAFGDTAKDLGGDFVHSDCSVCGTLLGHHYMDPPPPCEVCGHVWKEAPKKEAPMASSFAPDDIPF